MKKQLILFIGLILSAPLFAQGPDHMREGGPDKKEMNAEKRKEIEAQRVAYITTQLKLTPEESQTFWPIYNEYKQTVDEHRKTRGNHKKKMKDMSELSDKEVDEMLQSRFTHEREAIGIEEKYYGKFKQVLPIKKVAEFYQAERGFKKELLKSLQGRDGKRGQERQQR